MDDQNLALIVATIAFIAGAATAYGKVLGPIQVQLVEWIIEATALKSRFKGLLNLAVGVALAVAITVVTILQGAPWWFLGIGLFGGMIASIEASKAHDAGKTDTTTAQ